MTRKGFTLVETLAVCGIVSVLAAILLGTLLRPLERMHRTNCASNLAQIGKATLLYAGDNDDYLPPYWLHKVSRDGDPSPATVPRAEAWRTALLAYAKEKSVFFCPADPERGKESQHTNSPNTTITSYDNIFLDEHAEILSNGGIRLSLSEVKTPNIQYLQDRIWPDIENLHPDRFLSVHGNIVNSLRYDGSVKVVVVHEEDPAR